MLKENKKFTVISLFSGGMGLDLGLELTKRYEILACVEKRPEFCNTIRKNRDKGNISNNLKVYEKDIKELDPKTLLNDLSLEKGQIDLIVGGPPCQSFSTAGRRGTLLDPRGTLLWDFLRFIEKIKPKFFLMENVRGLMSAAVNHRPIKQRPQNGGPPLKPDEEPGSVLKLFLKDLNDEYRMDCFEVNSVNYGVPQIRERVLFFGNRYNLLMNFPLPTHGIEEKDNQMTLDMFSQKNESKKLRPYNTIRSALDGLNEEDPVIMDFSPRKKKYLSMVPPGGNWRCLSPEIAEESMGKAFFAKGGRSGWWRRLNLDLPAPTILTMPNHAGTALCHPEEVRALTLRECARIQGFPDWWEFEGKPSDQYAQVGNAVPIKLGEIAGNIIYDELLKVSAPDFIISKESHPLFRIVYIKSHVRLRQWYKDGKSFIWKDGKENKDVRYGDMKTIKKVRKTVIKNARNKN